MRETTLAALFREIESVDDEMIVFVPQGDEVNLTTPALVLDFDESEEGVPGYRYLLEVELVKDVIEVWSEWRDGQVPSPDEKLSAVLHYARNDAYQPV